MIAFRRLDGRFGKTRATDLVVGAAGGEVAAHPAKERMVAVGRHVFRFQAGRVMDANEAAAGSIIGRGRS